MASTRYFPRYEQLIPIDIIDDLCCRFIYNLLPEKREVLKQICFNIELAYWFYLDNYCRNRLNRCGMKLFANNILHHVPQLKGLVSRLDVILYNWHEYKKTVPTYGAILLNTDLTHVLLVKAHQRNTSFSFPKGKMYENEEPWDCATREVLEETGFDISQLIIHNEYIEDKINRQIVGLYIIPNVPLKTKFRPLTRQEIKFCKWFPLANLPLYKKDITPKIKMGISPNAFFLVQPFVKRIKRWVAENYKSNRTKETV